MAVVTAPLMSAEARGRAGGLVYNTYRGKAYVKAKTAPAQPRTELQMAIRAIAIGVSRAWRDLTPAEQAAWNVYAADHTETNWTGNPTRLTGSNWFLRLNTRLLRLENPIIEAPPAVAAPPPLDSLSVSQSTDDMVITWDDPGTAATNAELWMSGPHSAGQQPRQPKARFAYSLAASTETKTIAGIAPGTYDVWARVIDTATGLVSLSLLKSATMT